MFKYDCPNCEEQMEGSFGDDVTCNDCGKTYETDWDYIDWIEGLMDAWIVKEVKN